MYKFLADLPIRPYAGTLNSENLNYVFCKKLLANKRFKFSDRPMYEYDTRVRISNTFYDVTVGVDPENETVYMVNFSGIGINYRFEYSHSGDLYEEGYTESLPELTYVIVDRENRGFDEIMSFRVNGPSPGIFYARSPIGEDKKGITEILLCKKCLAVKSISKSIGEYTVSVFFDKRCNSHELEGFFITHDNVLDSFSGFPSVFLKNINHTNLLKRKNLDLEEDGIRIKDGFIWFHKDGKCVNSYIDLDYGVLEKTEIWKFVSETDLQLRRDVELVSNLAS